MFFFFSFHDLALIQRKLKFSSLKKVYIIYFSFQVTSSIIVCFIVHGKQRSSKGDSDRAKDKPSSILGLRILFHLPWRQRNQYYSLYIFLFSVMWKPFKLQCGYDLNIFKINAFSFLLKMIRHEKYSYLSLRYNLCFVKNILEL